MGASSSKRAERPGAAEGPTLSSVSKWSGPGREERRGAVVGGEGGAKSDGGDGDWTVVKSAFRAVAGNSICIEVVLSFSRSPLGTVLDCPLTVGVDLEAIEAGRLSVPCLLTIACVALQQRVVGWFQKHVATAAGEQMQG